MQQEFYILPLAFDRVMRKQEHPKCTLQQSVMQHLHLLITTGFGEFPADAEFGCSIWEHDFDNVTSGNKLKEIFRQSLLRSVQEQEKRLTSVRIDVLLRQEELTASSEEKRVKKKIDITVTGLLILTNERFAYRDSFFVGPLSY